MIKYLQKRTLNLMYWTFTIIFLCSLLMTDIDGVKIHAVYALVMVSTWCAFDKRYDKHFE
jgi:hypothetical protein